jgi:hypothetical protein
VYDERDQMEEYAGGIVPPEPLDAVVHWNPRYELTDATLPPAGPLPPPSPVADPCQLLREQLAQYDRLTDILARAAAEGLRVKMRPGRDAILEQIRECEAAKRAV